MIAHFDFTRAGGWCWVNKHIFFFAMLYSSAYLDFITEPKFRNRAGRCDVRLPHCTGACVCVCVSVNRDNARVY